MIKKQNERKIVKATSAEEPMDKGIELSARGTEGFAELTAKQQVFVVELLSNGFNATRAATAAGYAPNSAHVEGSRLLRNAKVAAVMAKAFEEHGITSAAVKILLGSVAFSADVADFEPWIKGKKTLKQLRAEGVDTRAVKTAVESSTGRRIELHNRLEATNQLARILGLVINKHETETTLTLAQALANLDTNRNTQTSP